MLSDNHLSCTGRFFTTEPPRKPCHKKCSNFHRKSFMVGVRCGVAQSWTWLKRLSMHARTGEGNGNPLQCSCLKNPRDRGVWWAAVYGVAQSWPWLKRKITSSIRLSRLLVQDGGVEGHVLISSFRSTKITTSCWTAIDKMLKHTKERYPKSKDKK